MCLAIPGKILSKENIGGVDVGQVQIGAITRQVALGFVPEAEVGDYVMVRHQPDRCRGGPAHL
jgi:hydrogenase expression/formation protein HypC